MCVCVCVAKQYFQTFMWVLTLILTGMIRIIEVRARDVFFFQVSVDLMLDEQSKQKTGCAIPFYSKSRNPTGMHEPTADQ